MKLVNANNKTLYSISMKKINWGIIGCGDVTELKSGPAFNKVNNSALVAVMRRDVAKASDYAARHQVPTYYSNANLLINDPNVNAIYIATPPSTHREFTLAALAANKPVYVEKPMALNYLEAQEMADTADNKNIKLVVAHYRRAQPFFLKIKQLLSEKIIGETRFVRLDCFKAALSPDSLKDNKNAWRVDPAVAGGGLFNDLAPHQLDLMRFFFGEAKHVYGTALNQAQLYKADDMVSATIQFESGVVFTGLWNFNIEAGQEKDLCEIVGSNGKISFSVFDGHAISVTVNNNTTQYNFTPLQHVQQPMIENVVAYFLGEKDNPCTGNDGAIIMKWINHITAKK